MQDIIFWGTCLECFWIEAGRTNKLVTIDVKTKEPKLTFTSAPVVANANGEFMLYVRAKGGIIGELDKLTSIQNLGAYVAVLNSPSKRETYDRIYPNAPYEVTDIDGNSIVITPPERFGDF